MSTPPVVPPTPDIVSAPRTANDPTQLRAGDSWQWTRVFGAYPSGQGWTLQYVLNSPQAIFQFPAGSILADADGQSFDVLVTATQTAGVAPGIYDLYAVLTLTQSGTVTGKQTILLQSVNVSANVLGATTPIDTRSFVKKTLDMLEAAISGDASPLVQEYEIAGNGGSRRINYMNRTELMRLRDEYRYKYDQERAANGEFVPKRKILLTFRPQS